MQRVGIGGVLIPQVEEAKLNQESLAAMDVITHHFVGKPGTGCRVTCPRSRFYVQVDWISKHWPTSGE
jgi:hypothetical protein